MQIYIFFSIFAHFMPVNPMKKDGIHIVERYIVATLGLILVAFGVALSLKSNLGTAPISCPPAMPNLRWSGISVGTFTWIMHVVFILFQLLLLRKKFKWSHLMQLPAAFVFGYLCDGAIWACGPIEASSYAARIGLCLATVVLTAAGLRLEMIASAWMLAGDRTIIVLGELGRWRVSTVKVVFDIVMVVAAVLFAWFSFGRADGDGVQAVVREGTLILALLTGPCMRLTDPLVDRLFPQLAREYGKS